MDAAASGLAKRAGTRSVASERQAISDRQTVTARQTVSERRARAARAEAVVASHRDDDTAELFAIGQLCAEFGITLRTIRFYEDKGLLAPRRVGGTRVYTRRDRARLALVLRSKAIGASLTEIRHYLDLYGARGEGRLQQMRFVLERTDAAITDLETRRSHIEASLAELRLINGEVRRRLQPG